MSRSKGKGKGIRVRDHARGRREIKMPDKDIKVVIDLFWRLTNQDFNIRLVDVENEKNNGLLAGVSFPPFSRSP